MGCQPGQGVLASERRSWFGVSEFCEHFVTSLRLKIVTEETCEYIGVFGTGFPTVKMPRKHIISSFLMLKVFSLNLKNPFCINNSINII